MYLVPFCGQDYENQNRHRTSFHCHLGCKTCLEKFLFSDLLLGQFWLVNSGFWVIPKIIFANLCKPIHHVMITQVSSDPSNLENMEMKEKNQKNLNTSRTKSSYKMK